MTSHWHNISNGIANTTVCLGRTATGFVFNEQNLVYASIIDSEPSKGDRCL